MRRLLMMLGIMALLAGLAGTASPTAAADITTTGPCADLKVEEKFDPPLGLLPVGDSGTVSKRVPNRKCLEATVSTSPPGASAQLKDFSHGWVDYGYTGGCALAAYSFSGGLGLIVGGTVDVFADTSPPVVSALVLVPKPVTSVCNVSHAEGAGVVGVLLLS